MIFSISMTDGVHHAMDTTPGFKDFVGASFARFNNHDWGDLCDEDKKANDYALTHEERILAAYEHETLPKIWIIQKADRSATTILFPDEY